jgi:hypothetical protein
VADVRGENVSNRGDSGRGGLVPCSLQWASDMVGRRSVLEEVIFVMYAVAVPIGVALPVVIIEYETLHHQHLELCLSADSSA